jgi:hypothetical protein
LTGSLQTSLKRLLDTQVSSRKLYCTVKFVMSLLYWHNNCPPFYAGNKCLNLGDKTPPYMRLVEPGALYKLIDKQSLPPAMAPRPTLTNSKVIEPPLPPVAKIISASSPAPGTKSPPGNAQPKVTVCFLSNVAVFVASLLLLWMNIKERHIVR